MTSNPQERFLRDVERLEAIRDELRELLLESKHLVRRHLTQGELDRAERSWIAGIEMALDAETRWLGRPAATLESDLALLRARAEEIDDVTHPAEPQTIE